MSEWASDLADRILILWTEIKVIWVGDLRDCYLLRYVLIWVHWSPWNLLRNVLSLPWPFRSTSPSRLWLIPLGEIVYSPFLLNLVKIQLHLYFITSLMVMSTAFATPIQGNHIWILDVSRGGIVWIGSLSRSLSSRLIRLHGLSGESHRERFVWWKLGFVLFRFQCAWLRNRSSYYAW